MNDYILQQLEDCFYQFYNFRSLIVIPDASLILSGSFVLYDRPYKVASLEG